MSCRATWGGMRVGWEAEGGGGGGQGTSLGFLEKEQLRQDKQAWLV